MSYFQDSHTTLDEARSSRAPVVQRFNFVEPSFPLSDTFGSLLALGWRSSEPSRRAVFVIPQRKRNVGLAMLDAEIRPNRGNGLSGNKVCSLPDMQGLTVTCRWLLNPAIASERLLKQLYGFGPNLLDTDALLIVGIPRGVYVALAVGRPLDGDVPIRVNNAREISQQRSIHAYKYTPAAAAKKGGDGGEVFRG